MQTIYQHGGRGAALKVSAPYQVDATNPCLSFCDAVRKARRKAAARSPFVGDRSRIYPVVELRSFTGKVYLF